MLRVLFFFILLASLLHATDIKNVYVLQDTQNISFDNIEHQQGFSKTTLPIKIHTADSYWVKIELAKELFQPSQNYLLAIESEFGRDNILYPKNYKHDTLYPHLFLLQEMPTHTFYCKVNNITNNIYLHAKIVEKKELYQAKRLQQVLYGISYGVMITAIFYYFAFFFFNREKTYLYYALTQFFMLISLFIVTLKSSNSDDDMLFVLIVSCFYIFTALFTASFLELKKFSSIFHKVIILSTLILIIEAYTNFFTKLHIPTAQLMLMYPIIATIIFYKTRFIYILFYIVGWALLIISLFFIELQIIFLKEHLISPDTLMHIVMPLESLIFALAISYKMRLESLEKQKKEQLLIHYDKKASIGDMVDNIAHQWRQPLTHIGYIVMNISAAINNNKFNQQLWQKKHDELTTQLNYMSETITAFRDFYKPSTQQEYFDVEEAIHTILLIIEPKLRTHEIELHIKKHSDLKVYGNINEFSQVILNLLVNAQEAFHEKNIMSKTITITIGENEIFIDDNAGGIEKQDIEDLFEPYVTTKENGSGIGLAMSKLIIEQHFNAKLNYKSISNGSRFIIKIQ